MNEIPLEINLKTLSAVDCRKVEKEDINQPPVDSLQQLISNVLGLEKVYLDGSVYGLLPTNEPSILPRAKVIPTRKAETRWEKFAKEKGIKKVSKKRVVWNEERGEYLPTFGYKNQGKSTKDLSDWIHEVPDDEDPNADVIAEKRKAKKERIAKNEMQNRRNLEEGMAQAKGIDHRSLRKEELRRRLHEAKKSNASMGKFDKLQDGIKLHAGKRKYDAVTKSADEEKELNLKILSNMEKKQAKSQVSVISRKAVHALSNEEKKEIGKKMMAPKSGKKKRKRI